MKNMKKNEKIRGGRGVVPQLGGGVCVKISLGEAQITGYHWGK